MNHSLLKIASLVATLLTLSCGSESSGKKVSAGPDSCQGPACEVVKTCGSEASLVNGACLPKAESCPAGQVVENGSCVDVQACADGTVLMFDECVAVPLTCSNGLVLVNGSCVVKPIECKEGFKLVNNRCEAIRPTPTPTPTPTPPMPPTPGPNPSPTPEPAPGPGPTPVPNPVPSNTCPAGSSFSDGNCVPTNPTANCADNELLVNGECRVFTGLVCPEGQTLVGNTCGVSQIADFRVSTQGTVTIDEMKAVKARFKAVFDSFSRNGLSFSVPYEVEISGNPVAGGSKVTQLTATWIVTVSKSIKVAEIESLIISQGLRSTNGITMRYRSEGAVSLAELLVSRGRLGLALKALDSASYSYELPYQVTIQEQALAGQGFKITELTATWTVQVAKDAPIATLQNALTAQGVRATNGQKLRIRSLGKVPFATVHSIRSRFEAMVAGFEAAKYQTTIPYQITVSEETVENGFAITELTATWNVKVGSDLSNESLQSLLIRQGIRGSEGHKLRFRGKGLVNLTQVRRLNLLIDTATTKLSEDNISFTLPYQITVSDTLSAEGPVQITQLTATWNATIYHGSSLADIESMILSQGVH